MIGRRTAHGSGAGSAAARQQPRPSRLAHQAHPPDRALRPGRLGRPGGAALCRAAERGARPAGDRRGQARRLGRRRRCDGRDQRTRRLHASCSRPPRSWRSRPACGRCRTSPTTWSRCAGCRRRCCRSPSPTRSAPRAGRSSWRWPRQNPGTLLVRLVGARHHHASHRRGVDPHRRHQDAARALQDHRRRHRRHLRRPHPDGVRPVLRALRQGRQGAARC